MRALKHLRLSIGNFVAFSLLLAGIALFSLSSDASAYYTCAPGNTCDAPGQQCTYWPQGAPGCRDTLTCNAYSYNTTTVINVPDYTACFCFQNLQVTKVEDLSLSGQDANVFFKLVLRQSQLVSYHQETVTDTITQFFFNAGGNLICPTPVPTPPPCGGTCNPTPTPCPTCNPPAPTTCGIPNSNVDPRCFAIIAQKGCGGNWCIAPGSSADFCLIDRANNRIVIQQDAQTCIDPPVACDLYLSGPSLPKTFIGTENFNALPNFEYEGVARINRTYFTNPGVYSLDVDCDIELPNETVACTAGCTSGGARVNFHVDTCNTAISTQVDKYKFVSGERAAITGTVRNNNLPVSSQVTIRIQDAGGNAVATVPASAVNGEYAANFIFPSSLPTGAYTVNATTQYNACPVASATVNFGYASCGVTLSANVAQSIGFAQQANVTGQAYNNQVPIGGANVTAAIYKNGGLVGQYFTQSLADGSYFLPVPAPFTSGTYTANVEARYLNCPAATQQRSFATTCDLRAAVTTTKQTFSSGDVVAFSGTLQDSRGTAVPGTYEVQVRNANGAIIKTSGASTQSGLIYTAFSGLGSDNYEATVYSTSGACSATDKVGFGLVSDFDVSLVSSPACGATQNGYQVKIKNNLGVAKTVTIVYSSIPLITLVGPSSVYVDAYKEAIINIDALVGDGFSGGSLGIVNFQDGNHAATLTLELPICATGNLDLTAIDKTMTGFAGQKVCYRLHLENKGPQSGTVTMSYDSGSYPLAGYYNFPQFRISGYETRDDLEFCGTVPNQQFSLVPITFRAGAPFGKSSDTASLLPASAASDLQVAFSGCPQVAPGVQFPIDIYNNGETADYNVEISDNGYLHPKVSPSTLYSFGRYTHQTVVADFSPTGLLAANYVTLSVRKNGAIVRQQQLCFNTLPLCTGTACRPPAPTPTPQPRYYGSALRAVNTSSPLGQLPLPPGTPPSAKLGITVFAPQVDYAYNGTTFLSNASFLVQNNEDRELNLRVDSSLLPAEWAIEFEPRYQLVRPGEIKEFTVKMATDRFEAKTYAGIFSVSDGTRLAQSPFNVDASKVEPGVAGTITGFLSGATSGMFAIAVIILLAIGAILYYGIRRNRAAPSQA